MRPVILLPLLLLVCALPALAEPGVSRTARSLGTGDFDTS